MGFVGGHTGHVAVRDLRDEGVTTNFVWINGETRTNVTILQKGREHVPIQLNELGIPVSTSEIERFIRRYNRMLTRADWVVLAGSLPPGLDTTFYRELTSKAKESGVKVVISAGGAALEEGLKACPFLVKPDIREHVMLEGTDIHTRDSIIETGRKIVECGVEMIIISHDVTGDIVITRDDVWEIGAPVTTTQFKNLVGADDALLGGVLFKLTAGAGVEEALRFGMAAGILSAQSDEKVCKEMSRIEDGMADITVTRVV